MLDVELFADEGSKEICKDSDDDPAMKTSISDSEDTSDEEPDTEAMGISSPSLAFLLIVVYTFVFGVFPSLPCMSSYYAVTEAPEELL